MAQVVRWYLCPLEVRALDGKLIIPQSIRTLLQGRWTYYRLPGDQWALVRIRGEDTQHTTLAARPECFAWPRGRAQRWNAASSVALRQRLIALGIVITGNPF